MKEKTPMMDEFVCFQIGIYFSEKLPLSQKLRYFRGSRFPQCFILPTARYQVSFRLIFVLSNYQTCTFLLSQVQLYTVIFAEIAMASTWHQHEQRDFE